MRRPGERVLDVACGTGVVAREAASRIGAAGRVLAPDGRARGAGRTMNARSDLMPRVLSRPT